MPVFSYRQARRGRRRRLRSDHDPPLPLTAAWTRRSASEAKQDLLTVMAELGGEDVLCRSVGPRRPIHRAPVPEAGPTYWMQGRNGQAPDREPEPGEPAAMPDAAWCKTCSRPTLIDHRFECHEHRAERLTHASRQTGQGEQ